MRKEVEKIEYKKVKQTFVKSLNNLNVEKLTDEDKKVLWSDYLMYLYNLGEITAKELYEWDMPEVH